MKPYFAPLFCVVALTGWGWVEEIPDADMGAPTHLVTNEVKSTAKSPLKSLKGRLYTYGNFDWQRPDPGLNSLSTRTGLFSERSAQVSLNGELTFKPSDFFTAKIDGKLAFSTEFPTNTAFFKEGARDQVLINEAFVEWYPGETLSVLVGKYRRVFSPGLFANPMDRHNPNPSQPGAQMIREGAYLAQVTFHGKTSAPALPQFSLDFGFLPSFFRDDFGLPSLTNTSRRLQAGPFGSVTLVATNTNWQPEDMGGFFRLYVNLFKSDLNLIFYRIGRDFQGGFSFAKPLFPWLEFHGEGLLYGVRHLDGESGGPYLDACVGLRVEPTDDIGLTAEWLHFDDHPASFPGTNQGAQRLAFLSQVVFPTDTKASPSTPLRDYLAMNLSFRNVVKDVLDITLNSQISLIEPELSLLGRVDLRVGDHAKVALISGGAFGAPDGYTRTLAPVLWRVGAEILIGI